jgi:hypothetical protein
VLARPPSPTQRRLPTGIQDKSAAGGATAHGAMAVVDPRRGREGVAYPSAEATAGDRSRLHPLTAGRIVWSAPPTDGAGRWAPTPTPRP